MRLSVKKYKEKKILFFPCSKQSAVRKQNPFLFQIFFLVLIHCRMQVLQAAPEVIFCLIPAAPLLRIFLSSSCVDICCGHSSPALSSAPRWLEKSWLPMVISSRRRPWGLQIPRRGAPALVAALPPRSFCSPCIYGARRPSPWLALRPAAAPVNFLLAGQALAPA
jgi:hypothetical protein